MLMSKMTSAQAIVKFLINEGVEYALGIFGHGCVQFAEALYENRGRIKFILVKNEQAAVHIACAYAKLTGKPLAVVTSVGPGATNLVTGAAMARVNRIPVLLFPGEVFANAAGPVLQQVESNHDVTANDCLKPVSKFFARLSRSEQIMRKLREGFDAMMEPGNEGPAVFCMPMDFQAEAHDFDEDLLFRGRDRRYSRICADTDAIEQAAECLINGERPLIIAGGGVIRSGAQKEMCEIAEYLSIPVVSTQSGKGSVLFDHYLNLFAAGPTGTECGNKIAREADVILGIGTRYSDFVTASETAFRKDAVFINCNICYFDAGKERAIKLWGDARETLKKLLSRIKTLTHNKTGGDYLKEISSARTAWIAESGRWLNKTEMPLRQSAAIRVINDFIPESHVVISAAGTLPGDLQKLWKDKSPEGIYMCEYGYSTMGFEIPAGIGAKLACPEKEVFVLVGDLSFLMMPSEIVTAAQMGLKYTIIVFDNHGGQSIRHLQQNNGFSDYGMEVQSMQTKEIFPVDFRKISQGMGAEVFKADDEAGLLQSLEQSAKIMNMPVVIHLIVDKEDLTGGYGSWWDVPVPECDSHGEPNQKRSEYEKMKKKQVIR
jgi:3D-(3,5/4)-trihydroxycyclohexane-1,2-dione acylhydrolase (decyclizing)